MHLCQKALAGSTSVAGPTLTLTLTLICCRLDELAKAFKFLLRPGKSEELGLGLGIAPIEHVAGALILLVFHAFYFTTAFDHKLT